MNPIKDTVKKVRDTISRYNMIEKGDLIIVAVSGGPDSICLLDILFRLSDELSIKLIVAHYNHGLRAEEDEEETRFVRSVATSMNLPFKMEKASLLSGGNTASIEEKARNARYNFLERLRDQLHARKIAVGHNLNDQAETFLMRLLRGSALSGLSGIPPCRGHVIIRPLIEMERAEITTYLKARGLSYVIDSSNLETRYLRNKIRLELLPALLEYQPRLVEHIGQLVKIFREENKYLEREAENWTENESEQGPDGDISVPVSSFIKLESPVRSRVIRHIITQTAGDLRRIDRGHIYSVYRLASGKRSQGMINLPNGLIVKRVYGRLIFSSGREQERGRFHYLIEGPGELYIEEIDRTINIVEMEKGLARDMGDDPLTAHIDAEKVAYPLIIRNFRPGDRFIPLGMNGHRKLKDFFIDLKIPSEIRGLIPILVNGDTPVLICGRRIDDRFKITSRTERVLRVTISSDIT